jgi:hypothetical protein
MNQTSKTFVILGLILSLLLPAAGQEKKGERISAVAVGTGGILGGRTIPITFRIQEYTSDETLKQLAETLAEGGVKALRKELEKLKVGRAAPLGHVGNDIAVARSRQTEKGRRIILVTARNLSFFELRRGGRSLDYPFSWIQIDLDEEGKGQGNVIAAARIDFGERGVLEVESLGVHDIRLSNVRLNR